jgi:hypothetical protein
MRLRNRGSGLIPAAYQVQPVASLRAFGPSLASPLLRSETLDLPKSSRHGPLLHSIDDYQNRWLRKDLQTHDYGGNPRPVTQVASRRTSCSSNRPWQQTLFPTGLCGVPKTASPNITNARDVVLFPITDPQGWPKSPQRDTRQGRNDVRSTERNGDLLPITRFYELPLDSRTQVKDSGGNKERSGQRYKNI